jgi:uncharacterized protein
MIEEETAQVEKISSPGVVNTEACLLSARDRSEVLGIRKIVIASSSGNTALAAMNVFDPADYDVIIVSHVTGFNEANQQELPASIRHELIERGGKVLTAAHAFGGVGRGVRNRVGTFQVDEIIAHTLRMFGQGTKVGIEIALMAADAGWVRTDEDVIVIAGTGGGADTALVLQPANSHNCLDLKVREFIVKPAKW